MAEPRDRRTVERFPVNADAGCPFASPVVEDFGPARIKDLSMQGVGLLTSRPVAVGAMLAVVLENKARGFKKTVLVRVAHATTQAGAGYVVGGNFTTPLTYQEMSALVL